MMKPKPAQRTMSRHHALYQELRQDITSGRYDVGDVFPTEETLRDQHGVSRYALREAMGTLEEEGLIERRRGAGTRVISHVPHHTFRHMAGSRAELLAYTQQTRVEWEAPDLIQADGRLARLLGCDELRRWYRLKGVRREENGDALGVISLYIDANRVVLPEDVDFGGRPIYEWLEDHFNLKAASISQDISARPLTAAEGVQLGSVPGSCSLQIIRRYFDSNDGIFEISVNVHRSHEFVYNMRVQLGI